MKIIVVALVFMTCAPRWVACASLDCTTAECQTSEKTEVQGNEEASLLQLTNVDGTHANLTKEPGAPTLVHVVGTHANATKEPGAPTPVHSPLSLYKLDDGRAVASERSSEQEISSDDVTLMLNPVNLVIGCGLFFVFTFACVLAVLCFSSGTSAKGKGDVPFLPLLFLNQAGQDAAANETDTEIPLPEDVTWSMYAITGLSCLVSLTWLPWLLQYYTPHLLHQTIMISLFTFALVYSLKLSQSFLRFMWYKGCGMDAEDIVLARGPRESWDSKTVQHFVDKYGMRRVKVMDAINRRFGHTIDHIFRKILIFPNIVDKTQAGRVYVVTMLYCCTIVLELLSLRCQNIFCSVKFQGARIRDGRLARVNLIMVSVSCVALYPLSLMLLLHAFAGKVENYGILITYVFQPCNFGDTMAELIGSFFGRLEFSVRGFGEINKKTLEGCLACFTTCFLVCKMTEVWGDWPRDAFIIEANWLHVATAVVATLAETFSFRSTDNGLMTLAAALVMVALAKH